MSQITISPVDSKPCVERPLATNEQILAAIEKGRKAYSEVWRKTSIEERCRLTLKMVDEFVKNKEEIGREISLQMGRPIRYSPGEVGGFAERARYMVKIAPSSLKTVEVSDADRPDFTRFIKRESLGVVLVIPAWNYPLNTAVNGIVPAILAGNTVILKHSQQTPLCAERISDAFKAAGFPDGVFQYLHMSHASTDVVIRNPSIAFVNFTGSVEGGRRIYKSVSSKVIGICRFNSACLF